MSTTPDDFLPPTATPDTGAAPTGEPGHSSGSGDVAADSAPLRPTSNRAEHVAARVSGLFSTPISYRVAAFTARITGWVNIALGAWLLYSSGWDAPAGTIGLLVGGLVCTVGDFLSSTRHAWLVMLLGHLITLGAYLWGFETTGTFPPDAVLPSGTVILVIAANAVGALAALWWGITGWLGGRRRA